MNSQNSRFNSLAVLKSQNSRLKSQNCRFKSQNSCLNSRLRSQSSRLNATVPIGATECMLGYLYMHKCGLWVLSYQDLVYLRFGGAFASIHYFSESLVHVLGCFGINRLYFVYHIYIHTHTHIYIHTHTYIQCMYEWKCVFEYVCPHAAWDNGVPNARIVACTPCWLQHLVYIPEECWCPTQFPGEGQWRESGRSCCKTARQACTSYATSATAMIRYSRVMKSMLEDKIVHVCYDLVKVSH